MQSHINKFALVALTLGALAGCATLESSDIGINTARRNAPAAAVRSPPPGPSFETTRAERAPPPGSSVLIPAVVADNEHSDLMDRMRAGFVIPEQNRDAIDVQLAWFQRNPEYLDRVFGRAALYMHHIVSEVERRGMPMEIALLPVIESA